MFALATAAVVLTGIVSPGHPLNIHTHQHYKRNDSVRVRVYVNDREIPATEWGHCTAYYYVRGVTVRETVCGTAGLRVAATGLRTAKIRVSADKM